MPKTIMPTIDRNTLNENIKKIGLDPTTEEEYGLIATLVFKGKTDQIRASKPKVVEGKPETGKAAYVWRMVAFMVSSNGQHHCMPMCADFDLPAEENGRWSSSVARAMSKELDRLVDAFVDCVPKTRWHGVSRWSKAIYGR